LGTPMMRMATSASAESVLQAGSTGLAPLSWGWSDNGWGSLGPLIYFNADGPQVLRVQQREDGVIVDQIVLSPSTYILAAPGPRRSDATILTRTGG